MDIVSAPAPAAVVCHDAGAANIVIAGLRASGRRDWRVCMQGPALQLWTTAFPGVLSYPTPEAALEGAACVISGTGWASSIEHDARRIARFMGIPSAAVLDHWVNYPERFVRQKEIVMPDEFWVTDDDAMEIAERCFVGKPIVRCPNYYVEDQLRKIRGVARSTTPELLYVLEPARSTWGRDRPGEFQALDYFVENLHFLNLPPETLIRLRPHPSDPIEKYNEWVALHRGLQFEIDHCSEIYYSLGRASWVAGCESFALALALRAGHTVFCTLPPWAPACCLPQNDLIHIATLAAT